MAIVDAREPGALAEAARRLAAGELVAFPTETVYGLGAHAGNPDALAAIYARKGRPLDHPVIVHVAVGARLDSWADPVPTVASRLVERFWPGPLTLVMKRAAQVPPAVSAGQSTIGLRSPAHPVARALLAEFTRIIPGAGIAAPSANRFGRISPTTAAHVRAEFDDDLFVLDGGPCAVGIESTILDLSRLDEAGPAILRPGAITAADLEHLLGRAITSGQSDLAPRVSGSLAAHYAPRKPLRLCSAAQIADAGLDIAVWSFPGAPPARSLMWRVAPRDPVHYAQRLYAVLREMDASAAREIWIEEPPRELAWMAVRDRLVRAATGSGSEPN